MVSEGEELKQTLREVERYLKQEGFTLFYGVETGRSQYLAEVFWVDGKLGWKGFLQAAKETGTKVIIIQASSLPKEELQAMLLESQQDETKPVEVLRQLEDHADEVGHFSLFWFKDGIKYYFSQATPWWREFIALRGQGRYPPPTPREMGTRSSLLGYGVIPQKVPDEIMKKSEEELADELVEFMKREFPEEEQSSYLTYKSSSLFWKLKGLETHMFPRDPAVELKTEKAERLARVKLDQQKREREMKLVPKLVDECAKWAKEHRLKKVTKGNVELFLSERDQALSKISRDAIYNKVNLLLAK